MATLQFSRRSDQKPLVSLQQAIEMVKMSADQWAEAHQLGIQTDSLVVRLGEDGRTLRVQARFPRTSEERRALENYAWYATATFLGYQRKYGIIH